MRPVGVETDREPLLMHPPPDTGVSTGCSSKGFVVSALTVRARQLVGLHGLHPRNTGPLPPGGEPSSLLARDWVRRGDPR